MKAMGGQSAGQRPRTTARSYLGLALLALHGAARALTFEPGVGAGIEYTDNAALAPEQEEADTITVGYVGLGVKHDEGSIKANVDTSFSKNTYTKGTFEDQRYLKVDATIDWGIVKDRFNVVMRDNFTQTPVVSTNTNRPTNIQDANAFTFGANWLIPTSAKNQFSLTPEYRKFYYEVLQTDNIQYSLEASWFYRMFRLTSVGLSASLRQVDYEVASISDTEFNTLQLNLNTQRARSTFSLNAGATNVKRDSESFTGFSGDMLWRRSLTRQSNVLVSLSSSLTDSSNGRLNAIIDPDSGGDFENVQIATDVLRNRLARLAYSRTDGTLDSKVWGEYRELLYSDSPNDRKINVVGIDLKYPVTALFSSGFYTRYDKTRLTELLRDDKTFIVGINFSYKHARKLRSSLDFKYREKRSTVSTQNYREGAVFYNLVYGFGRVARPTRVGSY